MTLTARRGGAAYGGNPQVGGAGVEENFKELRWSPEADHSIVRRLYPE